MLDFFDNNREYLLNEYEHNKWSRGLSRHELRRECEKIKQEHKGKSVQVIKSYMIECILTKAQIEVNPDSLFADKINHCDIMEDFKWSQKSLIEQTAMRDYLDKTKPLTDAFVFTGDVDFSHTCPNWDTVLNLGLKGIRDKAAAYLAKAEPCSEVCEFYESLVRVYNAAIIYVKRLADEAGRSYMISKNKNLSLTETSLRNICEDAPRTAFEALQLIIIYYMLQQHMDGTNVRSLGGLDTLLYPYYKSDLENGAVSEQDIRIMIKYFMAKMCAKKAIANIPFYLCGRDSMGRDLTSELTHIILDEYIALGVDDPKIHIRCSENTDPRIIETVLKSIRSGKNSFVFMNDSVVEQSLVKSGAKPEDARRYTIIGCYEPAAYGEVPCSCAGRINIPQIVMLTLTDGIDLLKGERLLPSEGTLPQSYGEFTERLQKNIRYICACTINMINEYEKNYPQIHSSPFFSSTFEECLNSGRDVYEGSAAYNNTSVCAFGLATAVDSVTVIKKAVFEQKLITVAELTDILKNNWSGSEILRRQFANLYPKYGNNIPEVDGIMTDICSVFEKAVNGQPNGRNGIYRLGLFSIDWRFFFGKCTPATPDGRFAQTTVSKNMCSVLGCDKAGVTSLINSVTKIDYTNIPNGTVLDIILHYSSVAGDEGLMSLRGLLGAFFNKGGNAIQFNILNPQKLRLAQKQPEKYKTLQIRLCGWNVYFVDLSKEEQDEFIKQTEHMGA